MRHLHPTALNEKFFAQGVYKYFRDGEELPITESWSIHELPYGGRLVRVDEDARQYDGLSILTEALMDAEYGVERFNVMSDNAKDDEIQAFKSDYSLFENYVQISQRIKREPVTASEFPLIEGGLVYLRQTIYMGFLIRQMLNTELSKAHIFTPALLSTDETQTLRMQIEAHEKTSMTIGKKEMMATRYQFTDDKFCWIADNDIVLRREYLYDGVQYEVQLTDFAHRP